MKNLFTIDELWSMACNNEKKNLRRYYEAGGEINRRYKAFGENHSLIMGALRNGNTDTALYLLSVGETVERSEVSEFAGYFVKMLLCL